MDVCCHTPLLPGTHLNQRRTPPLRLIIIIIISSSSSSSSSIIIIIIIKCNWVVTRWQWLFYMYTKHEIGYY